MSMQTPPQTSAPVQTQPPPLIGKMVPGYDIPVINERAVRVSAGILFVGGAISYGTAILTDSPDALKPFGMYFIVDMALRIILGDRWSPTIALGRLLTAGTKPNWVGARQKEFAWWMGFSLGTVSCSTMGLFAGPFWLTLALCGLCLFFIFLEAAFGICVGCKLQKLFDTTPPQYCPGGTCTMDDTSHHSHSTQPVP